MRGRYKRKDLKERNDGTADTAAGLSPPLGETAAGLAEPNTPVPGFTVQDVGGRKKGRAGGGERSKCLVTGNIQLKFRRRTRLTVDEIRF